MKSFVAIAVFAVVLAIASADFGYDDGSYMVGGMGGGMGGMGGGMGGLIGVMGPGMGGVGVQYPYMGAAAPSCRKGTVVTAHALMPAQPLVQAGHSVIQTTNTYSLKHPGSTMAFPYGYGSFGYGDDSYYGGSSMYGGHGGLSVMGGTGGMYGGSQMYGNGLSGSGQMAMAGAGQFGSGMGTYGTGQQMFASGMSGTY